MLAPERRNQIELLIKKKGTVYVDELSEFFSVTKETIRKDLEKLEKKGVLTRTYGGAVLNSTGIMENMPYIERLNTNAPQKQIIAEMANGIFSSHMTIFMDCSTTAMEVLKKITIPVTVISNSIHALSVLGNNVTYLSTGGVFTQSAMSLSGSISEKMLSEYYTDVAVIGCKALNVEHGITESNREVVHMKQIMVKNAGKVILCADSSKFDKTALTKLLDFTDVDIMVTDKKPSDVWLELFAKYGIKTVYP